jgi:hypothetical protein
MRSLALAACLLLAPLPPAALRAQSADAASALAAPDGSEGSGERLKAVLPEDVAMRVLRLAAEAREHQRPGAAIESAALELRAKGASPTLVERRVTLLARTLADAQEAMTRGRDTVPDDAEMTAAAAAISRGVTTAALGDFVRAAPRDRSLALPLFVVSSLVDRGLPAREALGRVAARLTARASDEALLALPDELFGIPLPAMAGAGAFERFRAVGGAARPRPLPAMARPMVGALRGGGQ